MTVPLILASDGSSSAMLLLAPVAIMLLALLALTVRDRLRDR
jgi:hypothetical protein